MTNEPFKIRGIGSEKLSYIEAVILEALRISPPAPVIPEIIMQPFNLDINGKNLELPQGSLVFMPMEALHTLELKMNMDLLGITFTWLLRGYSIFT